MNLKPVLGVEESGGSLELNRQVPLLNARAPALVRDSTQKQMCMAR